MAGGEVSGVTSVTGAATASLTRDEPRPPRVIGRRAGLPGGRAALGGLLMAIAAVGVYLAYADAAEGPTDRVLVTTRHLRVGEVIVAGDVRLATADLPGGTRAATFASPADVVGRVTLGPIGDGEILQAAALTSDRSRTPGHEIAITLPREQIAVGRLKQGERVDVFVTYEERTTSVVRGAEVVQIGGDSDRSLTSDRELSIVVAVPSGDVVAALVHALRTGEVTVVRSTRAEADGGSPIVYESAPSGGPAEAAANGDAGG